MTNSYDQDSILDLPIGDLCLMPLRGTEEFTKSMDEDIKHWRKRKLEEKNGINYPPDYLKETYITKPCIYRFGTGEAKGVIHDTVRGADIFIIVDITNYNEKYKMFGAETSMSPDDHYQDLKRIIAATNGKAKRVNVIMPFLYESRQHRRTQRESLDCAIMLQELVSMGVTNIITVDAHDPRISNAIPLASFDSINCYYQFIHTMLSNFKDIVVDADHLMMIAPDDGAMTRNIYFANVLGIDLGMFYKRRDYTKIVDGKNPIISHEFLGNSVEGKDVIIADDMISSGDSLFDTMKELKKRKAKRVFACCTFGLFTNGLDRFDEAYKEGLFNGLFTTNCIYQRPELFDKKWYFSVDVSEYLAKIIDCINHDSSISNYLNPVEKIHGFINTYNSKK